MNEKNYNPKAFPLRIPESFAARINFNDSLDPLLLQVLPNEAEEEVVVGYVADPLAEECAQSIPGLLHKYHGRVLLTIVADCPIHCRFCFRRHFKFEKNILSTNNWENILKYIANDESITEVILSGGEPLLLSGKQLVNVVSDLAKIKHLKRLRVHTRLPIVMPEKITESLVDALAESRLHPVVVIHCNHSQELDVTVRDALAKFTQANIQLLNQSVLLKNINASASVLSELNQKLFSFGVLPYYLHMLDHVAGVAHFAVSMDEAKKIMCDLRRQLPGYLVPRLVVEEAGGSSKNAVSE